MHAPHSCWPQCWSQITLLRDLGMPLCGEGERCMSLYMSSFAFPIHKINANKYGRDEMQVPLHTGKISEPRTRQGMEWYNVPLPLLEI